MTDLYVNRLTEDLAAMTKRALRAEAQVQAVREVREEVINSPSLMVNSLTVAKRLGWCLDGDGDE